jgi:hypothetical protein
MYYIVRESTCFSSAFYGWIDKPLSARTYELESHLTKRSTTCDPSALVCIATGFQPFQDPAIETAGNFV